MKRCNLFVLSLIAILTLLCCSSSSEASNAKTKVTDKNYSGDYYMKGGYKEASENNAAYNIIITDIKNKKVSFSVTYEGRNSSPAYATDSITAKIKNNQAKFSWKDTWNNKGIGIIKFKKKGKVLLRMIQKEDSGSNRATLDTGGEKIFLRYESDYDNGWYGAGTLHDEEQKEDIDYYERDTLYKGTISDNKLTIYGSIEYSKSMKGLWDQNKIRRSKKRTFDISKKCKYFGLAEEKQYMTKEEFHDLFNKTFNDKLGLMLLYKISGGEIVELGFAS